MVCGKEAGSQGVITDAYWKCLFECLLYSRRKLCSHGRIPARKDWGTSFGARYYHRTPLAKELSKVPIFEVEGFDSSRGALAAQTIMQNSDFLVPELDDVLDNYNDQTIQWSIEEILIEQSLVGPLVPQPPFEWGEVKSLKHDMESIGDKVTRMANMANEGLVMWSVPVNPKPQTPNPQALHHR